MSLVLQTNVSSHTAQVNLNTVSKGLSASFNRLWTLMGTPVINVPGLTDTAGLPLGLQVIGRFGRDQGALEAAWFLEQAIR